jgi:hypothetical protein
MHSNPPALTHNVSKHVNTQQEINLAWTTKIWISKYEVCQMSPFSLEGDIW